MTGREDIVAVHEAAVQQIVVVGFAHLYHAAVAEAPFFHKLFRVTGTILVYREDDKAPPGKFHRPGLMVSGVAGIAVEIDQSRCGSGVGCGLGHVQQGAKLIAVAAYHGHTGNLHIAPVGDDPPVQNRCEDHQQHSDCEEADHVLLPLFLPFLRVEALAQLFTEVVIFFTFLFAGSHDLLKVCHVLFLLSFVADRNF